MFSSPKIKDSDFVASRKFCWSNSSGWERVCFLLSFFYFDLSSNSWGAADQDCLPHRFRRFLLRRIRAPSWAVRGLVPPLHRFSRLHLLRPLRQAASPKAVIRAISACLRLFLPSSCRCPLDRRIVAPCPATRTIPQQRKCKIEEETRRVCLTLFVRKKIPLSSRRVAGGSSGTIPDVDTTSRGSGITKALPTPPPKKPVEEK